MSREGTWVRSKMVRLLACLAAACLMAAALTACGGSSTASSAASSSAADSGASASASSAASADASAMRTFTDSAGREVQIPATIDAVAVTGPVSQQVLFTIAPEKLVGLSNEMSDAEKKYIGEQYAQLPVFGQIYGGKGDFNKEAVASANPQLVIDVGEAKKSIVEDLDAIEEAIGIPCVHIEATYDTYDQAYTMLGELLGVQDRAAQLSQYCANAYETTAAGIGGVAADDRVKVAYLLGDAGLNAMANGSFQATVVDYVADNVAVVENAGGSGLGSEVSFEQIALWDPQMIIFGPGSIYATAGDDPSWSTLKAVQDGNYYEVPGTPYNWISSPPSVNQILGLQWFARLCYPDQFADDIQAIAKDYYQTMYGYELSDDECQELVANSLPKA